MGSGCALAIVVPMAPPSSAAMLSGSSDKVGARGCISSDSPGGPSSTIKVLVLFALDRRKKLRGKIPRSAAFISRSFLTDFQSHAAFDSLSSR